MSQKILGLRDEVDREKRGAGSSDKVVSDIAIFVLKRDVKLQLTNSSDKVQHIERDDHRIRNEGDTRERARVTSDEERKIFTAFRKRM